MPICPRCGKQLSSDQALTYHLNRKYKCNNWQCTKCTTVFATKFDMNIHHLKCLRGEDTRKIGASEHFTKKLELLPFILCEYNIQNSNLTYITPVSLQLEPGLASLIGEHKSKVTEQYTHLISIYDNNGVICLITPDISQKRIKEVGV